ncbi:aldehyde dehydrogenase family protein [Herbihabitans rhizosphaerae]|uniref:aldehyde dehydrogenase family protein n=1 Tax=Herbihabitans rhizosphaerae TaxID=1872711 RepID=UPI001F5FD91E|nr:aldehyde dehydrogenase family protein [Herbihabitans rhizosphaerae]
MTGAASAERVQDVVARCAEAAKSAAPSLANAAAADVDAALVGMAERLVSARAEVLEANEADLAAAHESGMSEGLRDRLRLTEERLDAMAEQLRLLAAVPHPEPERHVRDLDGGLRLVERRRPVGVIGANYEARANVTVDVASQLVKSRNAGVLRTGSAALRSALSLLHNVIAPALADAGIDERVIQLVPTADRAAAAALVSQPDTVPLVILRGSGESTRLLAMTAAGHGVRTLAHADGGGVLYLDAGADPALAAKLITASLDRLGVCNRLNLLLVHSSVAESLRPLVSEALADAGVTASWPPHDHPLGYEWALDSAREATVTVSTVDGPADAARVANEETSGLAAAIVSEDQAAVDEFLSLYNGTGVFVNAPTRLLDGFKLFGVPETGINIDKVPGPRGPVTYTDLCLRQFAVLPA